MTWKWWWIFPWSKNSRHKCVCVRETEFLTGPAGTRPLGGTRNIAAVQGKDKTWEGPNNNPHTVTAWTSGISFKGSKRPHHTPTCWRPVGTTADSKRSFNQKISQYRKKKERRKKERVTRGKDPEGTWLWYQTKPCLVWQRRWGNRIKPHPKYVITPPEYQAKCAQTFLLLCDRPPVWQAKLQGALNQPCP